MRRVIETCFVSSVTMYFFLHLNVLIAKLPEFIERPLSGLTPYYNLTDSCNEIPWVVVNNLLLLDVPVSKISTFVETNNLIGCVNLLRIIDEVKANNISSLASLVPSIDGCGPDALPYKVVTQKDPVHICLHVRNSLDMHVLKTGYWHDCLTLSELLKDESLVYCGSYATEKTAGKRTRPCLFVDVGANVGVCSLQLAHEGHEVIAFEPDLKSFNLFAKSVDLNPGLNISLFNTALAEKPGTAVLKKSVKNSGGGSIVKGTKTESYAEVTVSTITLDQFLSAYPLSTIDLLKLDVERAEYSVLKGAEKALTSGLVRMIVFEVTKSAEVKEVKEMLDFLTTCNFVIYFAPWHQAVWILAEEVDYGDLHQLPEVNPNFLAVRRDVVDKKFPAS
jgi:FkbM family methyltransferase